MVGCGWLCGGFFLFLLFCCGVFGVLLVGVLFVFGRGCPLVPSEL